jgi:hypothetical protein
MIQLITELSDGSRYELDLNKENPIVLTKTFLELSDITKRKGDFSRSFDLPRTPKNDYYFGLFGDPSTFGIEWSPQILSKCWLLEDSNIVIEGSLKLISTDSENSVYTVSILGTIATIKNQIGDKGMNELNMIDWLYTASDISDTWDRSLFSGHVVFPVHDFGFGMGLYKKDTTANVLIDITDASCTDSIFLNKTIPAFRLNELLRMIITDAGFEVDGSWFDETSCEDIYVQADNPLIAEYTLPDKMSARLWGGTVTLLTSLITVPFKDFITGSDWDDSTNEYTAPQDGDYTFDIGLDITPGMPSTNTVEIQLQKNGTSVKNWTHTWNTLFTGSHTETLSAGDTIRVQIKANTGYTTFGYLYNSYQSFITLGEVVPASSKIDPSDHLANYKQIDFLKEIAGIFNLIIWKDSNNIVQIDTWNYYMETYGDKKDWSDKVDTSKKIRVSPINSELQNPINLEFKHSEDILNSEYIKVTGRSYGAYREDTRIPYTKEAQKPFGLFAPAPFQEVTSSVAGAELTEMIIGKYYRSEDDLTYVPPGLQLVYYCGTRTLASPYLYSQDEDGASCVQQTEIPVFSPFLLTAGSAPYSGTDWQVQSDTLDLNFTWFTPASDNVDDPTTANLYERYFKEMLRERYDEANKIVEFNAILTPEDIANFSFADTIIITINGTPVGLKILEIKDYSPNVKRSTYIKAMITFLK